MTRLKNVRNRRDDSLSRVGWDKLETLLAVYYRGQGYRVEHVGTGGTGNFFDGGIDLKLYKDNEFIVVQCKHWNAKQVTHNAMHELLGIMLTEGATGAILVTSGEFSAYARESAAKQSHLQLIDGEALRAMIGPLPEPMVSPIASGSRADAVMSAVGERLLTAAAGRILGGRPNRSPYIPLVQALLFVLFVGFVLLVVRNMLQTVQTTLSQSAARSDAHTAELQASRQQVVPYIQTSPAINVSPSTPAPPAGHPKPTMFAPTSTAPTTDEGMREWKRKNAESMKILEKTTPELKR